MDRFIALVALAPAVIDVAKRASARWLEVRPQPANIGEYIRMCDAESELLHAAGQSAHPWPWVGAVVRLMRPVMAVGVVALWGWVEYRGGASESLTNFAAAIGFYMFGDRTLFHARSPQNGNRVSRGIGV